MAVIATLLPLPLHVQRLRAAIRDRHELHECEDWASLTRTCEREPVRVAVVDLYWHKAPDFEGVRQLKQLYSRYARNRDLINVGAYVAGSDAVLDHAIALHPRMEAFLQQDMNERVGIAEGAAALDALVPLR